MARFLLYCDTRRDWHRSVGQSFRARRSTTFELFRVKAYPVKDFTLNGRSVLVEGYQCSGLVVIFILCSNCSQIKMVARWDYATVVSSVGCCSQRTLNLFAK